MSIEKNLERIAEVLEKLVRSQEEIIATLDASEVDIKSKDTEEPVSEEDGISVPETMEEPVKAKVTKRKSKRKEVEKEEIEKKHYTDDDLRRLGKALYKKVLSDGGDNPQDVVSNILIKQGSINGRIYELDEEKKQVVGEKFEQLLK